MSKIDKVKLDTKYAELYEEMKRLKKYQKKYGHAEVDTLRSQMHELEESWQRNMQELHLTREPTNVKASRRRSSTSKSPTDANKPLTIVDKMYQLRRELGQLSVGEHVLAKWPDDGWYYKSVVKEYLGDCKYKLEDSIRDVEDIYREDII